MSEQRERSDKGGTRSNERSLGRMHLAACYRLACRPCGSTFGQPIGFAGVLRTRVVIDPRDYRLSPVTRG